MTLTLVFWLCILGLLAVRLYFHWRYIRYARRVPLVYHRQVTTAIIVLLFVQIFLSIFSPPVRP